MGDSISVLKEIGVQKIHNDTHISKEYVQAIVYEAFDEVSSVQFNGFISILEREYDLDLSDLKSKGKAYFEEQNSKSQEEKKVFVIPQKKKSYGVLYFTLVVLVFLSFLYYVFVYSASTIITIDKIDDTKIQNAQKSIIDTVEVKSVVSDINETNSSSEIIVADLNTTTKDENIELEVIQEELEEEVLEELRTLKILPKNKVWAGYINIETNQKYQKIFRKEFALDIDKNWLLLFGAGTVKL
ncbi:MAG: hypothetical protein J7J96_04540, partial [Sulfurimonas sp.]|nr:hypothetical protein [Sulfurimonas sp.]